MTINVGGATYNSGIEIAAAGSVGDCDWFESKIEVMAKDLTVNVTGSSSAANAESYGLRSSNSYTDTVSQDSEMSLYAGNLTINVQDARRSVGIQAAGDGAAIEIRPTMSGIYDYSKGLNENDPVTALTLVINCTITDPDSQLHGIAVEALNVGRVTIDTGNRDMLSSGQWVQGHWVPGVKTGEISFGDSLTFNGDLVAKSTAHDQAGGIIEMSTGHGKDTVTVNSNIDVAGGGHISIDTGSGDDVIMLNGNISVNGFNEEARLDVLAGSGNDSIDVTGVLAVMNDGYAGIEAGDGHDRINLTGGMILTAGGSVSIDGGSGHDVLVLTAESPEQFAAYYKDWLSSPDNLNTINCESIIVQGYENKQNLPDWLSNALGGHDVQVVSPDVDLTILNDVSALGNGFSFDGSGEHDQLYVRFGEHDDLSGLSQALGAGGSAHGAEQIVLDMVDFNNNQSLDVNALNGMISSMRSGGNANADVYLRYDGGDTVDLAGAGWEARSGSEGTVTMNGVQYQVYDNADDQLGQLYVQLVTS